MICRIAKKGDIRPLCSFLDRAWKQMELPYKALAETYNAMDLSDEPTGNRIAILEDEGQVLAALGSMSIETDVGPGFEINLIVVDQDRPDKLDLLDRLSLYSARLAVSEGRFFICSAHKASPYRYSRDRLGMDVKSGGKDADGKDLRHNIDGDARDIVKTILERHPDWS